MLFGFVLGLGFFCCCLFWVYWGRQEIAHDKTLTFSVLEKKEKKNRLSENMRSFMNINGL